MRHTEYAPATWVPDFADYLSLAFWTATAFSPTDVSAVKSWAKLLMMMAAAASLSIGALVIARAINILQEEPGNQPAAQLEPVAPIGIRCHASTAVMANRESPCWGAGACRAAARSWWPA
jgi:hypothetical protein